MAFREELERLKRNLPVGVEPWMLKVEPPCISEVIKAADACRSYIDGVDVLDVDAGIAVRREIMSLMYVGAFLRTEKGQELSKRVTRLERLIVGNAPEKDVIHARAVALAALDALMAIVAQAGK